MSLGMNISGGNNMVGLRWYATMNDWMDCCVYVPREYEATAAGAIKKGIDDFWDCNDQCYGDCIEWALYEANVPHLIEYAPYDEETDSTLPSWEEHLDYLRGRGVPIHNI